MGPCRPNMPGIARSRIGIVSASEPRNRRRRLPYAFSCSASRMSSDPSPPRSRASYAPDDRTAAISCCGSTVASAVRTIAVPAAKLTFASITPGTAWRPFSTRRTQEAQLIPVTARWRTVAGAFASMTSPPFAAAACVSVSFGSGPFASSDCVSAVAAAGGPSGDHSP